jgi:acid stress-induced BolA-like protein IbaG/YrbA
MISPAEVQTLIETGLPGAEVKITDLTGTKDHYQAVVISDRFVGKTLIQQHQLVYGAVKSAMASEAIHALTLKTYTPDTWNTAQNS